MSTLILATGRKYHTILREKSLKYAAIPSNMAYLSGFSFVITKFLPKLNKISEIFVLLVQGPIQMSFER